MQAKSSELISDLNTYNFKDSDWTRYFRPDLGYFGPMPDRLSVIVTKGSKPSETTHGPNVPNTNTVPGQHSAK